MAVGARRVNTRARTRVSRAVAAARQQEGCQALRSTRRVGPKIQQPQHWLMPPGVSDQVDKDQGLQRPGRIQRSAQGKPTQVPIPGLLCHLDTVNAPRQPAAFWERRREGRGSSEDPG